MKARLQEFLDTLGRDAPPAHSPLLDSVWHGLKGAWERAHDIAQEESGVDAAWIHGWLHRIEGDTANAGYWYRQAHRAEFKGDTREEGMAIAEELLNRKPEGEGKTS